LSAAAGTAGDNVPYTRIRVTKNWATA